jgi:ketosteroid isomerase-like protein
MKPLTILLAFCTIFLSCSQTADLGSIRSAIDKSNQMFMDAVAKQDADAAMLLYTENTLVMPANSPAIKGREAAKSFLVENLKAGVTGIRIATEEVNGNGEIAVESGKYQILVGENIVDEGKYIVEWKKVGEMWLINKDMFNTDRPAPRAISQTDQPVGVVIWKVKKGNEKKIEDFVRNTLYASIDRSVPVNEMAVQGVRFLAPGGIEKDGTTRYLFIFDPMVKDADYNLRSLLVGKHGKEKGEQLMKEFENLTFGSEFYQVKQSTWY